MAFGETQEQLGKYLHYTKKEISKIENGKRDVSIDTLKKLSLHYFTPMAELTEENLEQEPVWKNAKITRLDPVQTARILFPIVRPHIEDIPACFREAVSLHEQIIYDYYCLEKNNEPDATDEISICREKYLASLNFPEVTIYAKANLVGLFLFMARTLTTSIYSKDMPYPLLEKLYEDPKNVGKMYNKNSQVFDTAISGLRQEFVSGMTSKFLNDLSENGKFVDLAEYYKVLTYFMNLVPENAGIVENSSRAIPLMWKLVNDGNPYMLNFIKIICKSLS